MEISDNFLSEVGLADLPAAARPGYLANFRLRLQEAVGRRVTERLDAAQGRHLETVATTGDDALLATWFEVNVPEYGQVVASELASLKARVSADATAILALEALATADDPAGTAAADEAARAAQATHRSMLRNVHRLLTVEFGVCVEPYADDALVSLRLPAPRQRVTVCASSDRTVTFTIRVSERVDFDRPGVASALLRTNARLIFGRLQRSDDCGLVVAHSAFADGLAGEQARDIVVALMSVAAATESHLRAIGGLADPGVADGFRPWPDGRRVPGDCQP
jgi:Protein of unknown function (DUF5663)